MQPARTLIGVRPAWRGRRWWPAGLAWALGALAMHGLGTVFWFDHLLRQAGWPAGPVHDPGRAATVGPGELERDCGLSIGR